MNDYEMRMYVIDIYMGILKCHERAEIISVLKRDYKHNKELYNEIKNSNYDKEYEEIYLKKLIKIDTKIKLIGVILGEGVK